MATTRDYYDILGVTKSSSPEEIKRAYRKLALEWHPDRNKSKDATAKFKEINEAYEVLSDEKKKQTYDQVGHSAFSAGGYGSAAGQGPFGGGHQQGPFQYSYYSGGSPGQNPFESFGFSDPFDIFEQFFGGGGGGRRAQRRSSYELTIDFKDAVHGVTKEVHVPKGEAGEGSVVKAIKIPPGVNTGTRIRFDSFDIVISVRPDSQFAREGDDIFYEQEISFYQAAVGTVLEVPTVEGNVKIRIQPGTQPGTLIRLRDKGMPKLNSNTARGDQYVKVMVRVPTKLSKKQKEFLEAFDKAV